MMKTPDEIKKGLECHKRGSKCGLKCFRCDLFIPGFYVKEVCSAALAYIQQLESRLAQAERERDAMHRDMKLYSRCKACKKFADGQDCPVHTECTYGGKALFEWRGVCPENTKE